MKTGILALAAASLAFASAADATVYVGQHNIAGMTVNLTFVTDGTIGTLDLLSLVSFQAQIIGNYNSTVTFLNGTVEFSGGGLSATANNIVFDTSKPAIFSVFGVPSGYYCIVGTGYNRACDGSGAREEGAAAYGPASAIDYRERQLGAGPVALASVLGPGVPEPASWAMLIAGFGLVGAKARRRRLASAA